MLNSLLNRRLCDFMKDNTAVLLWINTKDVCQVPGNRLALAVGIACKIDFIRILGLFFERTNEISLAAYIDILR